MTADHSLEIAAVLVGFILRSSLAFVICWLLARLTQSPRIRFALWLCFLVGSTVWVSLLAAHAVTEIVPTPSSHPIAVETYDTRPASSMSLAVPVGAMPGLGIVLIALGSMYLLTCLYLFLKSIRNQARLRWVLRFTYPPPVEIAEIFQPLAKAYETSRCELLVLSGIASPATIGWWSPIILLPDSCTGLERRQLSNILRHELHHIRRRDFLWDGLATVCGTVLFFHPAVHFAIRRLRLERELCCDLAVVAESPESRADYAESLVYFARNGFQPESGAWGIDFAAPANHLRTRLHLILTDPKRPPVWLVTLRGIWGGVIVLAACIAMPVVAIAFHMQSTTPAPSIASNISEISARATPHQRINKKPTVIANDGATTAANLQSVPAVMDTSERVSDPAVDLAGSTQRFTPLPAHIYNYSDSVDVQAKDDSAPAPSISSTPGRGSTGAFPSWTSIATDTLRQVATMGHDHDKD